jgi:hypothetical protein
MAGEMLKAALVQDRMHKKMMDVTGTGSSPKGIKKRKMKKVMDEWESGSLHSGSKHGPVVTSQAQAIAIGISEGKKAARGKY